eukprot:gene7094-14430_t
MLSRSWFRREVPSKKISPSTTPRSDVDVIQLDTKAVEDFIVTLKSMGGKDTNAPWNFCHTIAEQLKWSRQLLTLTAEISSETTVLSKFRKCIDVAYSLTDADGVYIFEPDSTAHGGIKLTMANNDAPSAVVGFKYSKDGSIEADAIRRKQTVNIRDVQMDPRYNFELDMKIGIRTKTVLVVPIVVDNSVYGAIEVFRKTATDITQIEKNGFVKSDEVIITFIAHLISIIIKESNQDKLLNQQVMKMKSLDYIFGNGITDIELENMIQKNMDDACALLHADKVSLFIHSQGKLVCNFSDDIKGVSIPCTAGVAGKSFSETMLLNIRNTQSERSFYPALDSQVGYKTRCILSAPIIYEDGSVVGVLQALNKTDDTYFNEADEEKIKSICSRTAFLLSKAKELQTNHKNKRSEFLRCGISSVCVDIHRAQSVSEVIQVAKNFIKELTNVSQVEFYKYICDDNGKESLEIQGSSFNTGKNSNSTLLNIALLPSVMMDAIRAGVLADFIDDCQNLLPDITTEKTSSSSTENSSSSSSSQWSAIVCPLTEIEEDNYKYRYVFIGARPTIDGKRYSSLEKKTINLISEVLIAAMRNTRDKSTYISHINNMQREFQLLRSCMSKLKVYIILLNFDGSFILSNKPLEDLFGDAYHTFISSINNNNTSSANNNNNNNENRNFLNWIETFQETLSKDIKDVIETAQNRSREAIFIETPAYPEGIFIRSATNTNTNWTTAAAIRGNCPSSIEESKDATEDATNSIQRAIMITIQLDDLKKAGYSRTVPIIVTNTPCSSSRRSSFALDSGDCGTINSAYDVITKAMKAVKTRIQNDPAHLLLQEQLNNSISKFFIQIDKDSISSLSNSNSKLTKIPSTRRFLPSSPPTEDPQMEELLLWDWDFDVLEINNKIHLKAIISRIFLHIFNFSDIEVHFDKFEVFLNEVEKRYLSNPFHNFYHASCVTHILAMLINSTNAKEYIPSHLLFALLISAVAHDIGHPGKTNMFEINSGSNLALLYNDEAVLENFHCSTTFTILKKPSANMFCNMSVEKLKNIRKMIVGCILGTDMAKHFQLVAELETKIVKDQSPGPIDHFLLGRVLLHAADLSNPVRKYHIAKKWAERLSDEFGAQVEVEKELGLPVQTWMITKNEHARAIGEKNFSIFTVRPMWELMVVKYPVLTFLTEQLDKNIGSWEEVIDRYNGEEKNKI